MMHTGFALLFALTMAVAAIGIQGTARADVIIIIRDGSAVTRSYYGQPYPYQAPTYGETAYESVPRPPAPIYGEPSYGEPSYGEPSYGPYAGAGYAAPAPRYAPASACYWVRGEPAWDGYRWVRRPVQVCN